MDNARHLSWNNLEEIIALGVPQRIPVTGFPQVEIIIEADGSPIGLITPLDPEYDLPSSPLAEILVRAKSFDNSEYIYVSAHSQRLFREFYSVITSIADRIQLNGVPAVQAIHDEFVSWQQLLRRISLLQDEQEVGLWGELWLLDSLVRSGGPSRLEAWTGPWKEPHDFRFAGGDVEIKTTRHRARKHIISDLQQLTASEGKPLYLLSLQIQPAGAGGRRLPDMIVNVSEGLSTALARQAQFWDILTSVYGYRQEHSPYYTSTYELRTKPTLINVDAQFPRITHADLARALVPAVSERIDHVQYTIDVTGLGEELDADGLLAVLDIS